MGNLVEEFEMLASHGSDQSFLSLLPLSQVVYFGLNTLKAKEPTHAFSRKMIGICMLHNTSLPRILSLKELKDHMI